MVNTASGPPPAPAPDERWNVNLPAVIGVVFVFLIAVIVWVITSTGGDDQIATDDSIASTTTIEIAVTTTSSTVPGTTTPAPMPVLTTVAPTTPPAPTAAPAPAPTAPPQPAPTAAPAPPTPTAPPAPTTTTTPQPTTPPTTAPGSEPGAVPGDLGIDGFPMQAPACDESYITIIASAIGAQATAAGIESILDEYDGSNYLRTDQTCPSLNQDVDGQPIYVVYFGPFPVASDACTARSDGTEGAYARQLGDDIPPDHTVGCPPLNDGDDGDGG